MSDLNDATEWKAAQRDWLIKALRSLADKWDAESMAKETIFAPDPNIDRFAKARTGGCANELRKLLEGLR